MFALQCKTEPKLCSAQKRVCDWFKQPFNYPCLSPINAMPFPFPFTIVSWAVCRPVSGVCAEWGRIRIMRVCVMWPDKRGRHQGFFLLLKLVFTWEKIQNAEEMDKRSSSTVMVLVPPQLLNGFQIKLKISNNIK